MKSIAYKFGYPNYVKSLSHEYRYNWERGWNHTKQTQVNKMMIVVVEAKQVLRKTKNYLTN